MSIRKIVEEEKLVTTEEAFMCIKDKELHPALRSAYIDFIISTLVDVSIQESGTTVGNIRHTFVSIMFMDVCYFVTSVTRLRARSLETD